MVREVRGDLLNSPCDIICHQVNCRGVMGAGLAKKIAEAYPLVLRVYRDKYNKGLARLGELDFIQTPDMRIVCNMYAQDRYGRDRQYTDYEAFKDCLDGIVDFVRRCESKYNRKIRKIGFPYNIGCGLAGGDWNIVRELIENRFATEDVEVEIYKL